ncbi:MAG: hemolysin III family protein, partial [Rhodopila sp.]
NAKDVLGKVDQAMIFMMIAGSYTPFAVRAFPPWVGVPLCGIVWTIAAMGVALCVGASRLFDRIGTALYLGIGWLVILVMPLLIAAVSGPVLGLLVAGGVVYSLGVVAHRLVHVAFHNVAWHGMVVAAAALHLAAIALILP